MTDAWYAAIKKANELNASGAGRDVIFVSFTAIQSIVIREELQPEVKLISCYHMMPSWEAVVFPGSVVVVDPRAWSVEMTKGNLTKMCDKFEKLGAEIIRNEQT